MGAIRGENFDDGSHKVCLYVFWARSSEQLARLTLRPICAYDDTAYVCTASQKLAFRQHWLAIGTLATATAARVYAAVGFLFARPPRRGHAITTCKQPRYQHHGRQKAPAPICGLSVRVQYPRTALRQVQVESRKGQRPRLNHGQTDGEKP